MAKILLVEDNEMNRDMLSRRLIKKGFEVVMAVDGQKGLEMATSETPDIILLDMSLPIMDVSRLLIQLHWKSSSPSGRHMSGQLPLVRQYSGSRKPRRTSLKRGSAR